MNPNSESELSGETGICRGGLGSGLVKRPASSLIAWARDGDYRWDP